LILRHSCKTRRRVDVTNPTPARIEILDTKNLPFTAQTGLLAPSLRYFPSMSTTPYKSLPRDRRVALVKHVMSSSREARATYTQRLTARGGFRAVTLNSWPLDKLASEFVRMNAQNNDDELDLLQLLYVELEPAIQITFLDAAGVPHENGVIAKELEAPFADADGVKRGMAAVRAQHGEDGERYLQTLARYFANGWPGIEPAI
jgi:hypothetical protein